MFAAARTRQRARHQHCNVRHHPRVDEATFAVLAGRVATPRITFLDEQNAKPQGRSVEEVAAESMAG